MSKATVSKKKTNGEGSIRQRADGKWEGRVTVGIDDEGKQKRKSVYGSTKSEVRQKITAILTDLDTNDYIPDNRMSVGEWLETWVTDYLVDVKDTTKKKYETDIRVHLIPALGKIKLQDLKAIDIQSYYNKLLRQGKAAKSIKCIHGVLHRALDAAVKFELCKKNPANSCEPPSVKKKEMCVIKDEDIRRFENAIAGHRYGSFYYIAMYTGLRESELIGLTWDCIDFDNNTIHVYRQLQRGTEKGSGYSFKPLKNGKSRTFTVITQVMDEFRLIRQRQLICKMKSRQSWSNPNHFVFTNDVGEHYCTHTVYSNFKKIVTSLGLPETRVHDLRHTFATISIECDCDIKTVSAALGHATTAFTMDVYGHVSKKMDKSAAEKLEKYISTL